MIVHEAGFRGSFLFSRVQSLSIVSLVNHYSPGRGLHTYTMSVCYENTYLCHEGTPVHKESTCTTVYTSGKRRPSV